MTQRERQVLQLIEADPLISQQDIAAKLGVSLATVYHERARGDTGQMDANGRGGYSAELAQSKIYARRQELQERH